MKANDTAKVQEIMDLRAGWNRANPTMPIMADPASLRRDLMLSGLPLDRRSMMLWSRRIRGENAFSETAQ